MKTTNIILIVVLGLLLIGSFIGGYFVYPQFNKCPEIAKDTVYVHDTVTHHIHDYYPWYIQGKDSIVYQEVPQDVDTNKILADYYALHIYPKRHWENDSIEINLSDTITQNKFLGNDFSYRLKFATNTVINNIDNSVRYDKYLQLGIGVPFKDVRYSHIELNYIYPKGSIGGYYELQTNSFGIKASTTILKIKGK